MDSSNSALRNYLTICMIDYVMQRQQRGLDSYYLQMVYEVSKSTKAEVLLLEELWMDLEFRGYATSNPFGEVTLVPALNLPVEIYAIEEEP